MIAASYSQTYKRNAFNNGFLCIDCPALVQRLKQGGFTQLTNRTGLTATVDFRKGRIRVGKDVYPFVALSETAQQLVVAGGVENRVRQQIAES